MTLSSEDKLKNTWRDLEKSAKAAHDDKFTHVYKLLDLGEDTGLRLGYHISRGAWEFLIEIGKESDDIEIAFPEWKGVQFELLVIDVPVKRVKHLVLSLESEDHIDVFVTFCADLADSLSDVRGRDERLSEIRQFLARWSRFFEISSLKGLSEERQRGLIGEIWWLRHLIKAGLSVEETVSAWKGPKRGNHDFEIDGHAVEVKTTLMKEPRKIWINNEKQLDPTGTISLSLLVLSIVKTVAGGECLPGIITTVRELLDNSAYAQDQFEKLLREAGYLDAHAALYVDSFTLKQAELFEVRDEFPRIIDVPGGIGDLRYSVVVSTCAQFARDINDYISELNGGGHVG